MMNENIKLTFWQKNDSDFIRFIVKKFNLTYCLQFYFCPRIIKTGAGYVSKNKGIAICWLGFMYQFRKPINER